MFCFLQVVQGVFYAFEGLLMLKKHVFVLMYCGFGTRGEVASLFHFFCFGSLLLGCA